MAEPARNHLYKLSNAEAEIIDILRSFDNPSEAYGFFLPLLRNMAADIGLKEE